MLILILTIEKNEDEKVKRNNDQNDHTLRAEDGDIEIDDFSEDLESDCEDFSPADYYFNLLTSHMDL